MGFLGRILRQGRAELASQKCSSESCVGSRPPVPEGYTPINEFSEQDIFIVGYPKSGNTWFQNLAAGVAWGVIPEYAPPKLTQTELVPDVHARQFYRRFATPMYFKSHHLPRPDYRRVVYLLRDGRDVMVSYHHFLEATRRSVDFLEMVREGRGLFPCKWHQHVEAWLANPYDAQLLVIHYHDLKSKPVHELARFCEFAGLERPVALLEMMAQSATFDKMRWREQVMGRSGFVEHWETGCFFVRRGMVGSFKDEMPAEVLDAFVEEAAPTLARTGFL